MEFVSEVVGEYARVGDAFERPTLRLLSGKWATLRVAVFRCAFSRERTTIPADVLHTQVDEYLAELRREPDVEVPANVDGRSLCRGWVNDEWLFRDAEPDGSLVYSRTHAALEALDVVGNMSRDRVLVSQSRLTTIVEVTRRLALDASPDAEARAERLDAQIRELEIERDRLRAGGVVVAASDDRMIDGFGDLLSLMAQLPSDFKRVEESMQAMHRQLLAEFRDREMTVTTVLDDYLATLDDLLMRTPEGRAFVGAFELLRDQGLLSDLQRDQRFLLEHPSSAALKPEEIVELRSVERTIRQGIEAVLESRRRLSATLKENIVNHNPSEEQELDSVLRDVERELATWMQSARPRSSVALALLPPEFRVEHLPERTWDPESDLRPAPLPPADEPVEEVLSAEELRALGGPSRPELRERLLAALRDGDMETVGVLFARLPRELRRPVEILGLLQLVAGVPEALAGLESFEAVRPDGSRRVFEAPMVSFSMLDEDVLTDGGRGE